MRRRDLFEMGAAAAALAAAQGTRAQGTSRARMKLGTQHADSDEILRTIAAFGVNHMCSTTPSAKGLDESWSVEGLTRLRE